MFQIRISKPETGNKFYNTKSNGGYSECIKGYPTDKGCNVLSNCVGYACGRFNEIIGSMKYPKFYCNAENFIERAKKYNLKISNIPTLGGIMVWMKGKTLFGKDGAGHVAIVERIDNSNQIFTSESAYKGKPFYNKVRKNTNKRWGMNSNYTFLGCIVNPSVIEESNNNSEKSNQTEIIYIVKKGDTLSSIASRYNTSWKTIYNKNKHIIGSNPNIIKPGQKLVI